MFISSWIKKKLFGSGVIALVRLEGVIGVGGSISGGINDQALASTIEKAFQSSRLKAVALIINSPGGSPSQSSLISARIMRNASEKKVPVYAFCEDVAASGGYWLACSAEKIYADENSIVGSIGVISAGFGFHEFIARQGVERRVYTSGEEKSMLDPFKAEKKEDIIRLKAIQKAIHTNFKNFVSKSRGARIEGKKIFTGEVWDAERAQSLGLIDGIGHLEPVLKAKFGNEIRFKKFDRRKSIFSRFGRSAIDSGISSITDKLHYSRFWL